jgi:DNA replication licensing factor MCM6
MPIRGHGLMDETQDEEQTQTQQQLVYVMHPNCAIEDME